MSRRIPLTKGYSTLVDDADYDWLSQWKWLYTEGYAVRCRPKCEPGPAFIRMHRLLMGIDAVPDPIHTGEVDHRNRDRLDNRRANLRLVTHGGNQRNTAPRAVSGEKGVRYVPRGRRWQAYTLLPRDETGRQGFLHLGKYDTLGGSAGRTTGLR